MPAKRSNALQQQRDKRVGGNDGTDTGDNRRGCYLQRAQGRGPAGNAQTHHNADQGNQQGKQDGLAKTMGQIRHGHDTENICPFFQASAPMPMVAST